MGLRLKPAVALVGALALAGACGRGTKTPEEAYQRLSEAVAARDAGRLFDVVELETRWSWMTVHRAYREAYDITSSNLPPGPDRERHPKRFEAAAHAESPRDLFARELPPTVWPMLQAGLGGAVKRVGEHEAEAMGVGGQGLLFRKDPKGKWGWGYAGFAGEAEMLKKRATADLELIRTSAADHERAAARGGK